MRKHQRRRGAVALALTGLLGVAACGGDGGGSDGGGGGGGGGEGGGTLVFGASSDPVTLDAAYVSDGESLRVIRQVFEGLVTTEEGGTEVVPALAKEWENSEDGLQWTFTLEEDVTFHDGEPFDAEAVCANFDRWYNFTGLQQSSSVSYYYQTVFGGYANNESEDLAEPLYDSCEASDETTAVITLTSPSASFLTGLTLPSFSIASPKALEEGNADQVGGTDEEPQFEGTFGTENPIGTGPFRFDSWEVGNRLVLSRNEDYWGEKAKLERLIFRPIADGPARTQALQSGEIQAFDGVDPADVERLRSEYEILERPAFNVGYLGFNVDAPPLDNLKIRQAIAHAINREALLQANYPEGSEVATQFMPPSCSATPTTSRPTSTTSRRPSRSSPSPASRTRPSSSGTRPTSPARTCRTRRPTSRPCSPTCRRPASRSTRSRRRGGPTTWRPRSPAPPRCTCSGGTATSPTRTTSSARSSARSSRPGARSTRPSTPTSDAARVESDLDARAELYQAANKKIMEFLPGVPYVHNKSFLVTAKGVEGLTPSPVSNEVFAPVSVSE
jgi:peptide/nickel transport system substrate-binding protein